LSLPPLPRGCEGAEIVYTDDGTDPRESPTASLYRDPIRIEDEMYIIKAYVRAGDSSCVSDSLMVETYIHIEPLPEPLSSPDSGAIEAGRRIQLRVPGYENVADVRIYYTTDGSDPVTRGTLYQKPFAPGRRTTVRAVAVSSIGFFLNSPVMSRSFRVVHRRFPSPVAAPPSTNFGEDMTVRLTVPGYEADSSVTIRYTLDHGDPDSGGIVYTAPLRLTATTTVKAVAAGPEGRKSAVTEELYVRGAAPVVHKPDATPPGGEYPGGIPPIRLSCATTAARICYTLDGSEPSMASTLYNGTPIVVTEPTVLKAAAFKVDHVPSVPIEEHYTLARLPEPLPSLPSGTVVADTQWITFTVPGFEGDSTVRIRYVRGGGTLAENGRRYGEPFAVMGDAVVRVQAYAEGYRPSPVTTVEYYAFARVVDGVYRDADGDGGVETVVIRFDRHIETIPGVIEIENPGEGERRIVSRERIHLAGCREEVSNCATTVALITVEPPFMAHQIEGNILYGTVTVPGGTDPHRFTLRPEASSSPRLPPR
jgi:hypothetical protein